MSTIPKKRIIFGWTMELFWVLINLILLPFTFFIRQIHFTGTKKEQVLIISDAFSSPLMYLRFARSLNRSGFSVTIFSSGTIFSSLSDHAKKVGDYLLKKEPSSVILFGHGLGGLVALKLSDAPRQCIRHLVPIGTPHNGTRLLLPFQWLPALADMAVGSQYILLHRANAMFYKEFTPFSAWQDQTIVPFSLSQFGQGRDLILDQVGHYNLVLSLENIDTIKSVIHITHEEDEPITDTKAIKKSTQLPVAKKIGSSKVSPLRIQQPATKKKSILKVKQHTSKTAKPNKSSKKTSKKLLKKTSKSLLLSRKKQAKKQILLK